MSIKPVQSQWKQAVKSFCLGVGVGLAGSLSLMAGLGTILAVGGALGQVTVSPPNDVVVDAFIYGGWGGAAVGGALTAVTGYVTRKLFKAANKKWWAAAGVSAFVCANLYFGHVSNEAPAPSDAPPTPSVRKVNCTAAGTCRI